MFTETGYKSINGVELFYHIRGSGEPIVVIHGGPGMFHDYFLPLSDFIPLESSQAIQSHIPGARLVLLEKCGHCPFIEAPDLFFPDLFFKEIKAFIQ